jgi:Spy/CpxP family protein refolding chaperone
MPYTKIAMAALAVAVTGAGAAGFGAYRAYAHGGFRGHGRHHAMFMKFVDFAVNEKLDEIQATPAQRQKVQELKDRLVARGKAIHDEKADTHEQLLALLAQDDLDEAKLRSLVKERTEAITRFADTVADSVIELHQTLTPEQRQKLIADLREHMAEHGR